MTEVHQGTSDPVSFAGGLLDQYRHVCAFVNSQDEMYQVLDPFVREGVTLGEKLLYFVDSAERGNLVRHLRRIGLDMPALLEQRQCEVRTWSETYLHGGRFDQNEMLGLLDDVLLGPPSPRIRLVADMGWAAEQEGVNDLLIEFEARANFVHPKHGHVVICVYDISRFGGDFVIDILRTHPMALIGGVLHVNPYFEPAAEFLEELRSRERRAPYV